MTAPNGSSERPGGWVEGIGWVARLCDLEPGCSHRLTERGANRTPPYQPHDLKPVIVIRWADGTVPSPSSPVEDGRPDTAALRTAALTFRSTGSYRPLLLAAADWIDAHPSPGTGDDGSGA